MNMEIRDARVGDHAQIVSWNEALARESEDMELDVTVLARGVEHALTDRSLARYFIAEVDDLPVGQLMLTQEWSDWRNGMFWWIQSVYVTSKYRGRGVFRGLYDHVAGLARDTTGVCGLRLYVHTGNTVAIEVYRKLGMLDGHYRVMETALK